MNHMEKSKTEISIEYGNAFEHKKWLEQIPFINFDSDWEVKVIPPFNGAVVRFLVKKGCEELSIYLDCYDILGYNGSPYWELYPDQDGDCFRCKMNDVDELLNAIRENLK